jgi:hypothetical protein
VRDCSIASDLLVRNTGINNLKTILKQEIAVTGFLFPLIKKNVLWTSGGKTIKFNTILIQQLAEAPANIDKDLMLNVMYSDSGTQTLEVIKSPDLAASQAIACECTKESTFYQNLHLYQTLKQIFSEAEIQNSLLESENEFTFINKTHLKEQFDTIIHQVSQIEINQTENSEGCLPLYQSYFSNFQTLTDPSMVGSWHQIIVKSIKRVDVFLDQISELEQLILVNTKSKLKLRDPIVLWNGKHILIM